MAQTKITGWSTYVTLRGVDVIITVGAEKIEDAAHLLTITCDFPVSIKKGIHKTCTVKYPGPLSVQQLPEFSWEEHGID